VGGLVVCSGHFCLGDPPNTGVPSSFGVTLDLHGLDILIFLLAVLFLVGISTVAGCAEEQSLLKL